jgi:hypothetical protein
LGNKSLFEERYMEIRYEAFVVDVRSTMDRILDFCGLYKSSKFMEMLPKTLPNRNNKWTENLSESQKKILHYTLQPLLGQLGYI